jgi:hypothetical protein
MPDVVALSLGAGVQSTTLSLLAIDGVLYAQVDRIAAELEAAGITFYRVSNGNLRRDAIDPEHRYASIPYFVKGPCQVCDGTGEVESLVLGPQAPESLIAKLGRRLGLPTSCSRTDFRPYTGVCPNCGGSGLQDGMGRRQCTSEYKLAPITRKVRELLGAAPPDYRRVPKGRVAEQWIGFSTDEVQRANRRKDSQGVKYLTSRYPLLELGMSRDDCTKYLAERGWGDTVKSACIGCPFHGNRQWRDLRDNHPDEWADAIAFDAAIRKGGSRGLPLNGEAFLHRSRVPLAEAPIDIVTRREYIEDQPTLLDVVFEEGDPDGCSPYGCRSGAAS